VLQSHLKGLDWHTNGGVWLDEVLRAKRLQVRGILLRLGAITASITGKVYPLSAQKSVAKPLMLGLLVQYFGQFLNREAMPTASFTNATQHRSKKSEWNLNPNKTEKKALF
jgi:hypothetical protein